MRRLFWDIETSPNVVLSWRIGRKINIDHDNLLHERAIICIAWKWEGEDAVHAAHWDDKQCDRAMLARFLSVATEAGTVQHQMQCRACGGYFSISAKAHSEYCEAKKAK